MTAPAISFEIHTRTAAMHGENVTGQVFGMVNADAWRSLDTARADLAEIRKVRDGEEFQLVVLGATHMPREGYFGLAICDATDGPLTEGDARTDAAEVTCPICLELLAARFDDTVSDDDLSDGDLSDGERIARGLPATVGEHTAPVEADARSLRREFIDAGFSVSLLSFDPSREVYAFDVLGEPTTAAEPTPEIPDVVAVFGAEIPAEVPAGNVAWSDAARVMLSTRGRQTVVDRGGDPDEFDPLAVEDAAADIGDEERDDIEAERAAVEGERDAERAAHLAHIAAALGVLRPEVGDVIDHPDIPEAVVIEVAPEFYTLSTGARVWKIPAARIVRATTPRPEASGILGGLAITADLLRSWAPDGQFAPEGFAALVRLGVNPEDLIRAGIDHGFTMLPTVTDVMFGRMRGDVLIMTHGISGYPAGSEWRVIDVRRDGPTPLYLVRAIATGAEYALEADRFERN